MGHDYRLGRVLWLLIPRRPILGGVWRSLGFMEDAPSGFLKWEWDIANVKGRCPGGNPPRGSLGEKTSWGLAFRKGTEQD